MLKLMEWHFTVQKGMYFDKKIETQSYVIYSSDITTDGSVNYAVLENGVCLEKALESIENDFCQINRVPCVYLPNDNEYEKKCNFLEQNGYTLLSEESVMLFDNKNPIIKTKASLRTILVNDEKSANDFIEVFISAYGGEKTPESPYGELDKTYINALSRTFADNQKFFNFVCYDGEIPVSIASLCFENGNGGIYSVGTIPAVRGKGFGTVAIKACFEKWIELNGTELFLQTETDSFVEKWYNSLGFQIEFIGRIFAKES